MMILVALSPFIFLICLAIYHSYTNSRTYEQRRALQNQGYTLREMTYYEHASKLYWGGKPYLEYRDRSKAAGGASLPSVHVSSWTKFLRARSS